MSGRRSSGSALLERDSARDWLEAELTASSGGAGRLVAIGGEAGVGKTSLLRELAVAHERDCDVRWGNCDPLATQRPLAPLVDIARGAPWLELLDRPGSRAQVFDALLRDLTGSPRPVLVVVEDVHWADDSTLDLLVYLQRRVAGASVLVVVTYRDDEVDSGHPLRPVLAEIVSSARQRLHLNPLSADAVAELAVGTGIDPTELHRVTGGNPFFVTESLAGDGVEVAPSVRDAVLARSRRLSAEARRALEAVAIVPGAAEMELVVAVADIRADVLDEPVEQQILRLDGTRLSFRHELARRAWLDSIPPVRLRRLHRHALDWLTRDAVTGADPTRLAHHAVGSQDPAAILSHSAAAGAVAAALQAHREAAAHYANALEHADPLPPLERAALCSSRSYECYLTDQMEAAVEAHERALAIWRVHGTALQVGDGLRWSSRLAWLSGRGADAMRCATEAVEHLEPWPDSIEAARAASNMSQVWMLQYDREHAVQWGRRAIALAEALGDDETLAHALNNVGTALLNSGDDSGAELLERSLSIALERGWREHVARAYTNLGSCGTVLRQYDDAERHLRAGIDYCAAQDLDTWFVYMTSWLARVRLERGEWDEAVGLAQQVINRPGAAPVSVISALAVLGTVRSRRGDPDVWPVLDRALELAEVADELQRLQPVVVARAEAAWSAGHPETEVERTRALLERTVDGTMPWQAGQLAVWAARLGASPVPAEIAERCAPPFRTQLLDPVASAATWATIGCPYEAADLAGDSDDAEVVAAAYDALLTMGAVPRARQVADRLRGLGRLVPRGPNTATRANPYGLTDREVEVARELVHGGTDQEIADRLYISRKTASHHVSRVLTKLGARNRSEAAVLISRLEL